MQKNIIYIHIYHFFCYWKGKCPSLSKKYDGGNKLPIKIFKNQKNYQIGKIIMLLK